MASSLQQTPKPAMAFAVVVALIAVLGWMAYAFLIKPPDRAITNTQLSTDAWMTQLANKSGGDITKLSEAERTKLQQMTMGHGEMALKSHLTSK